MVVLTVLLTVVAVVCVAVVAVTVLEDSELLVAVEVVVVVAAQTVPSPRYPSLHTQVNEPTTLVQPALGSHGAGVPAAHSSMSVQMKPAAGDVGSGGGALAGAVDVMPSGYATKDAWQDGQVIV